MHYSFHQALRSKIEQLKPRTSPSGLLLVCALLLSGGCRESTSVVDSSSRVGTRPNVILILTDDQGFGDLGAQGILTDVSTPNLDQLAADGVRMTAGYVTAPQCSPSRAGLLTGRYQQRFGLGRNAATPMPLDEPLLSERLQAAGYVTGMVGKWQLDPHPAMQDWLATQLPDRPENQQVLQIPTALAQRYAPTARGFDEVFAGNRHSYLATYTLDGQSVAPQQIDNTAYRIDVQSDAAITFIERHHSEPFFLYLSYFAPHVPLEATEKYLARFPGPMPERRRVCLAMTAAIDDGIGRLREALAQHGISDNTIIFFLSDNGAPILMRHEDKPLGIQHRVWNGSRNDPLIGEKGMLTEGGIRVPFLVSWPAKLPKGTVYAEPVSSLDVAATALALAGLDRPAALDGVDLVPHLAGTDNDPPHQYLFWRFWKQAAVRSANWKYLQAGDREFLFHLGQDGIEKENLIDQHPEEASRLKNKLGEWANTLQQPGLPKTRSPKLIRTLYEFHLPGAEFDHSPARASPPSD